MTAAPGFTLDELLEYLREEPEAPKGYMTTRQWATYFEISVKRMRKVLREAFEVGILLRKTIRSDRYDGSSMPVQVYSFTLDKEETG